MLDEGCIELMHSGQTAGQAGANPYRVQIIDLRPIKNPMARQGAEERYRLKISDGRHYMHVRCTAPALHAPPLIDHAATRPWRRRCSPRR